MTFVAQLWAGGPRAERVAVGRDATLRDLAQRPIDIMVEDLSVTGFGMTATEDFPVGSMFNLLLGGISRRDVRVVRRFGLNYGCEFVYPLDDQELRQALSAGTVVKGAFGSSATGQFPANARPVRDAKLSPLLRIGVLFAAITLSWLLLLSVSSQLLQ